MREQSSDIYGNGSSGAVDPREFLFSPNTHIIKEGQPYKMIYGQFEMEKKSLYQQLSPYVFGTVSIAGGVAAKAGSLTLHALQDGFTWFYTKIFHTVLPFARQQLPKFMFLVRSDVENKFQNIKTWAISPEEFEQIKTTNRNVRVVVSLGVNEEKHMLEYLQKEESAAISYEFPIDSSSECIQAYESFAIPSEEFIKMFEESKQKEGPLKKTYYMREGAFFFELESQKPKECELLKKIKNNGRAQSGYIVLEEEAFRKEEAEESSAEIEDLEKLYPCLSEVELAPLEALTTLQQKDKLLGNVNVELMIPGPQSSEHKQLQFN